MTTTYTVLVTNEALRTAHHRGAFASLTDADAFARLEASRCRSFCTFEACEKNGKRVGAVHRGAHGARPSVAIAFVLDYGTQRDSRTFTDKADAQQALRIAQEKERENIAASSPGDGWRVVGSFMACDVDEPSHCDHCNEPLLPSHMTREEYEAGMREEAPEAGGGK